jgi:DnaJ-class molecular chaperone
MKYQCNMSNIDWTKGKEVAIEVDRKCQGKDCLGTFTVEWPGQRRCPRCRKEGRPYKDKEEPF